MSPTPPTPAARLQSIDVLRGFVMVVMAIDHLRDFFHAGSQHASPTDLTQTTVPLFLTRWITHFCAPVFVFLAGTSAWLGGRRGRSPWERSRLLLTRGLWLVVVEFLIVGPGASFDFTFTTLIAQVIWTIGWSMVVLAGLLHLPWRVLLAVSLALVAGHHLLDGLRAGQFGAFGWLWSILHEPFAFLPLGGGRGLVVVYPLLPWIGVMAAGYCFGRVFDLDPAPRRRLLLRLGLTLTIAFVALRLLNGYGDPMPWSVQPRGAVTTALSFLDTTKYPPSLAFLLMTLGPAITVLGLLDGIAPGPRNPLLVFGRVPLFYYVLHWYLLHVVALGLALVRYGRCDFLFTLPPSLMPGTAYPADYGYGLGTVYVIWLALVAALYLPCRWFAGVKARNRSPWLGYL